MVELVAVLAVACAGAPTGEDGSVDIDGTAAEVQEVAPASVAGNATTGPVLSSPPSGQPFTGRFGTRVATGGHGGTLNVPGAVGLRLLRNDWARWRLAAFAQRP